MGVEPVHGGGKRAQNNPVSSHPDLTWRWEDWGGWGGCFSVGWDPCIGAAPMVDWFMPHIFI